jgi:hypothetical protein
MLLPQQITYQAYEDDQPSMFNEVDDWHFPTLEMVGCYKGLDSRRGWCFFNQHLIVFYPSPF